MIISKTPFRVSFLGGGSDLSDFYMEEPGAVLCTSINKYIYLSIHEYFHTGRQLLKYSQTEEVSHYDEIKHDIIREVFRYFNIVDSDFNSTADIPSGTGMGSSSAFTCGLINLCAELKGIRLTKTEIARLACYIEIELLKEPIGKQDQYCCAVGGLNLITFNPDGKVEITLVSMEKERFTDLENNLFLYYTSTTRKASSILTEQKSKTGTDLKVKHNLRRMAGMAKDFYKDLVNGNIDILGDYLKEAWMRKKELSTNISNLSIDNLYQKGIANGATGGKLLGAGGGGFMLFYVPKEKHIQFVNNMTNFRPFNFLFDFEGTQIIFNDQTTGNKSN
jgi:D-glycero-alpha-D-manno-heptose-7-phosphate kinase